jgi:hypothetical protein
MLLDLYPFRRKVRKAIGIVFMHALLSAALVSWRGDDYEKPEKLAF